MRNCDRAKCFDAVFTKYAAPNIELTIPPYRMPIEKWHAFFCSYLELWGYKDIDWIVGEVLDTTIITYYSENAAIMAMFK